MPDPTDQVDMKVSKSEAEVIEFVRSCKSRIASRGHSVKGFQQDAVCRLALRLGYAASDTTLPIELFALDLGDMVAEAEKALTFALAHMSYQEQPPKA